MSEPVFFDRILNKFVDSGGNAIDHPSIGIDSGGGGFLEALKALGFAIVIVFFAGAMCMGFVRYEVVIPMYENMGAPMFFFMFGLSVLTVVAFVFSIVFAVLATKRDRKRRLYR